MSTSTTPTILIRLSNYSSKSDSGSDSDILRFNSCHLHNSYLMTAFERLVVVVAQLRAPDGCPWDREQTLESLAHYVLEEAYEVVDAIERHDLLALREEIGDHVFEGVFLAQIAAEHGHFTID